MVATYYSVYSVPDLLRPRSLGLLMNIYERNYQKIVSLLGDPAQLADHVEIELLDRPALQVWVKKRSRHTLELMMSHQFAEVLSPRLKVRLYRDASVAEAQFSDQLGHGETPLDRLPARWRANILLYKWLDYCLSAVV